MESTQLSLDRLEQTDMDLFQMVEVAALLSVSEATIRNWVKTGVIKRVVSVGRKTCFCQAEILKLKQEIQTGESHRLKSRANKSALKGKNMPAEYVSKAALTSIADKVLQIANKITLPQKERVILLELSLKLMLERNKIECLNENATAYVEAFYNGEMDLKGYFGIFAAIVGTDSEQPQLDDHTLSVLQQLRDLDIPFHAGEDFLGLIYLSLTSLGIRKNQGMYYTPSAVVDELINDVVSHYGSSSFPKAVDPCCGSGNFLIKLFCRFKEMLLQSGVSVYSAEELLMKKILAGFDIDPLAVSLATLNLCLLTEAYNQPPINIRRINTLFDDANRYNLVIGNPPWGYKYTSHEATLLREKYEVADLTVESFCVFIEWAVKRLAQGGQLAFVLPEALLNVETHKETRRLLLDLTALQQIRFIGNRFSSVFAPAITIVAEKNRQADAHDIEIMRDGRVYRLAQSRFCANDSFLFNIGASNRDESILKHLRTLENVVYLKDNADFALGIVTGDNKRYVSCEKTVKSEVVLRGSNIYKYLLKPSGSYIVFTPDHFQQVAPLQFYRAPERLLYRFINENLVFAYDDQQTLTLNSANIVIPRLPNYSMKYVLAVLNSRVAQFFHTVSYHSIKVLRSHLESIPLPACTIEQQKQIVALVNQLESTQVEHRESLYERIDQIISELYGLTDVDKEYILDKFRKVKFL